MPPHTTYLRITRKSVLQLRIFTEHPLDAGQRWLIHPTDPALPKVIQAMRHLILPKLREENARKYGAKAGAAAGGSTGPGRGVRGKKRVKDVVVTDDFEVSLFLTELPTRHSLLIKHKTFNPKKRKLTGNSTRLTDATTTSPNHGGGGEAADDAVVIPEEEDDDGSPTIASIPQHRTEDQDSESEPEIIDSSPSPSNSADEPSSPNDKKKLNFKTSYDGFSIWGWTLVLLIKRKDDPSASSSSSFKKRRAPDPTSTTMTDDATTTTTTMMGLKDPSSTAAATGKESGGLMEEWISTQALGDVNVDDEDVGD